MAHAATAQGGGGAVPATALASPRATPQSASTAAPPVASFDSPPFGDIRCPQPSPRVAVAPAADED
eukprot:5181973-Prymnesium_polylepis.1